MMESKVIMFQADVLAQVMMDDGEQSQNVTMFQADVLAQVMMDDGEQSHNVSSRCFVPDDDG